MMKPIKKSQFRKITKTKKKKQSKEWRRNLIGKKTKDDEIVKKNHF